MKKRMKKDSMKKEEKVWRNHKKKEDEGQDSH